MKKENNHFNYFCLSPGIFSDLSFWALRACSLFVFSIFSITFSISSIARSDSNPQNVGNQKVKYVNKLYDVAFETKSKCAGNGKLLREKAKEYLSEYVDVVMSAKYAAGPMWKSLNDEQKKVYLENFKDILIDSLFLQIEKIVKLSRHMVKVSNKPRPTAPGSLMHEIDANLSLGEIKIHFTFLVKHGYKDGKFKIIKIFADGLDVSLGLKTEFQNFIRRNGYDSKKFISFVKDRRHGLAVKLKKHGFY